MTYCSLDLVKKFRFSWITLQLVIFLVTEIQCRRYGPSIEYLTRQPRNSGSNAGNYNLNTKGKTLYLQEFPWKTVLIPLANGKPTTDPKTAYRLFHHFHFAHFMVNAPPGFRIMAVIQSLRLATNVISMSGCLDHIQFIDNKTGRKTTNICGEVMKDDEDFGPAGLIGARYFASDSNEISVEVLIVSSAIRSHGTDGSTLKRVNKKGLTVEISFTAFRYDSDCSSIVVDAADSPVENSHGNINNLTSSSSLSDPSAQSSSNIMRGCSPQDTEENQECIPTHLFCDGILHCGASTELEFGFDEHNCTTVDEEETLPYDIDESNIQYEIRYRKHLEELSAGGDLWLIHYVVLGLAGVVTAILIFSCLCYWCSSLLLPSPSDKNSDKTEETEMGSRSRSQSLAAGEDCTCDCDCGSLKTLSAEHLELDLDQFEEDLNPHRFRSKSVAPSKIKINPDGSHSFVAYQGNRRLTISVS